MHLVIGGWMSYTPSVERIAGWTMHKTFLFRFTSCLRRKDTRLSTCVQFAFWKNLGETGNEVKFMCCSSRQTQSLSVFGPFLLSMYLMFEWGYSPQEVRRLSVHRNWQNPITHNVAMSWSGLGVWIMWTHYLGWGLGKVLSNSKNVHW